jgi:polysaccharide export outer membrane protein
MKKFILFLGIIIGLLSTSCVPHKDTLYLQDKGTVVDSMSLREIQQPYRVQVNDILNIRVKALDQETVQILNPIGDGELSASGEERAFF